MNIEGLGRLLYPELDLWTTAKPLLKKWMREQRSPRRFIKQASLQLPYWRDYLLDFPDLVRASSPAEVISSRGAGINLRTLLSLLLVVLGIGMFGAWVFVHKDVVWQALVSMGSGVLWLGLVFCFFGYVLRRRVDA